MKSSSNQAFESIFKNGSKTYFNSSIFFPTDVRQDVFILYAFVRIPDDMVDQKNQDIKGLTQFIKEFNTAWRIKKSDNIIIYEFIKLMTRRNIEKKWVDDFLNTMKIDTQKTEYKTLKETEKYMYGSAEVVGLMMAKILKLPKKSYTYAKLLGKSMQYINFLRDIEEDNKLKRLYVPKSNLLKYGLSNLSKKEAYSHKSQFINFMRDEIDRYNAWQKEARIGFAYIPKRYLIPVKTASDMYEWTACEIYKNPLIVFEKKIKPSKFRILTQLGINALTLW
ncbi:MAG: phytoene/squalene synthase family protein [Candidatus Levybacteria bacterium]|nr:phytoene/squalene synthase family protein [Candidatus Levybacteria bacterium]